MSSGWNVWVPTWLEAVGTLGAFTTGGVLLYRELLRDREREERDVRQQASGFAVWPTRVKRESAGVQAVEACLQLSNSGKEPVYGVVVEYLRPPTDTVEDHIGMVPPGLHTREPPQPYGETWVRTNTGWRRQGAHDASTADDPYRQPWAFEIAVRFTDAAGIRWRRDAGGVLSQDR